jgi:hypothetical protein
MKTLFSILLFLAFSTAFAFALISWTKEYKDVPPRDQVLHSNANTLMRSHIDKQSASRKGMKFHPLGRLERKQAKTRARMKSHQVHRQNHRHIRRSNRSYR